ncbi:unknown [Bacteroides sp. CAG:714]|nr:unknown [Bacteroides sp. CAG:714]
MYLFTLRHIQIQDNLTVYLCLLWRDWHWRKKLFRIIQRIDNTFGHICYAFRVNSQYCTIIIHS